MKVIRTAIVLDRDSRNKLKEYVTPCQSRKRPLDIYCRHRILRYGDQELPPNLGDEVVVKLTDVFCSHNVACVATSGGGYITLFTTKRVPPKTASDIVNKEQYRVGKCYIKEVRGKIMAYVVDDDGSPAHWI